ncbi:hypothetical protein LINPERPRIM_LOCUS31859 [Linum perenne]
MTPSTEVFNELRFATFWVRLEDVPVGFRSLQFGSGLLQPVGQVLHTGLYDSPSENKELIRGFMNIDVTQPLLGRRKARYSNGGEFWVRFGFEGLPTVCFGCGMLGHSLRQCSAPFADGSSAEDRGSWMQAEKLTYHPVKTVGMKRSAEPPGSGGVTASVAATVSSDLKRQRLEMSADGLGLAQAQLGASTSLGRILASAPQPLQAPNQPISGYSALQAQPIGLDSSVRGRPSSSADCVMEDLVDGADGFLLEQSDLLEVVPRYSSLLNDLSSLNIANPSGSFDNGLPIDIQGDQLATSFCGFDQSLKVASGADQNRPAKGP